jgi:hypothetical protein
MQSSLIYALYKQIKSAHSPSSLTRCYAKEGSMHRRQFIGLALPAVAALTSRPAWAADYPTRPIHFVVGFPAGSGPDTIARLAGQALSARLGQEIVVDDRPGGNVTGVTMLFDPRGRNSSCCGRSFLPRRRLDF